MEKLALEPGLAGEASVEVTPELTAAALRCGIVPVFSTPMLVALLEAAAVHAVEGRLEEGQTTVGTVVNVQHLAATPVGMTVYARAVLTAVDGRRLEFEVSAWDDVERVAAGTHQRFILNQARFEERARAKRQGT